jgi:ATP adenylyltransferase
MAEEESGPAGDGQFPESLHAYWRMEYIAAPKAKDGERSNPFANLREADDREAGIVYRGETGCLLLNKYPYNAGHLLVLPYREVAELEDLHEGERNEFFALMLNGKQILAAKLKPDAFNLGVNLGKAAGAGIPKHVHGHVVPRWEGDTNFMPVLSDTRVLPMGLEAMWRRLVEG